MKPLPPRAMRPQLVLESLRTALRDGELPERLPPERQLCDTFGVSRATLRLALNQLKREELIYVKQKRTFVARAAGKSGPPSLARRRIVWLSGLSLEAFAVDGGLPIFMNLSDKLSAMDAHLQYHTLRTTPRTVRKAKDYIEKLQSKWNPAAWVLHRAGLAVEEYFSASAIPAFRYGNPMVDGRLPSLMVDFGAAARHALWMLYRLGHSPRRILCVVGNSAPFVVQQVSTAFCATKAPSGSTPLPHQLVGWPGVAGNEQITAFVASALKIKPVPTAIIVVHSVYCARILGILTHEFGCRLPRDLSVICLTDNSIFDVMIPSPSRYRFSFRKAVNHMYHSLTSQIGDGPAAAWNHVPLVPDFIPGQTHGPPPSVAEKSPS